MKKTRTHLEHVCENCWYYAPVGLNMGVCVNCDSPSDIRRKNARDFCDGGGVGADDLGFRPFER